jgi:hypothetical protein
LVNPGGWDSYSVLTGVTADPAAGAAVPTITVPAGKRWVFLGARVQLVDDATVANRYMYISIAHDGTNTDQRVQSPSAMVASYTSDWNFTPTNLASISNGADSQLGFGAGIELAAGATVIISAVGLVAGDNFGVCRYYYKEAPA